MVAASSFFMAFIIATVTFIIIVEVITVAKVSFSTAEVFVYFKVAMHALAVTKAFLVDYSMAVTMVVVFVVFVNLAVVIFFTLAAIVTVVVVYFFNLIIITMVVFKEVVVVNQIVVIFVNVSSIKVFTFDVIMVVVFYLIWIILLSSCQSYHKGTKGQGRRYQVVVLVVEQVGSSRFAHVRLGLVCSWRRCCIGWCWLVGSNRI